MYDDVTGAMTLFAALLCVFDRWQRKFCFKGETRKKIQAKFVLIDTILELYSICLLVLKKYIQESNELATTTRRKLPIKSAMLVVYGKISRKRKYLKNTSAKKWH